MSTNHPIEKLNSKKVFESKWMKFYDDEVLFPDGKKGKYSYLDAIPGVSVVVVNDKEEFLLIKEYRYPIRSWLWHTITGGVKEGQNPLDIAKEELKQEAGMIAHEWTEISRFYFAPGIESTLNITFLASDIDVVTENNHGQGDEAISNLKYFSQSEIYKFHKQDKMTDALTLSSIQSYFSYINQ